MSLFWLEYVHMGTISYFHPLSSLWLCVNMVEIHVSKILKWADYSHQYLEWRNFRRFHMKGFKVGLGEVVNWSS